MTNFSKHEFNFCTFVFGKNVLTVWKTFETIKQNKYCKNEHNNTHIQKLQQYQIYNVTDGNRTLNNYFFRFRKAHKPSRYWIVRHFFPFMNVAIWNLMETFRCLVIEKWAMKDWLNELNDGCTWLANGVERNSSFMLHDRSKDIEARGNLILGKI